MFPSMVISILYSTICHLVTFDALIESGFRYIQKSAFVNLCKAYHDVIVIPFFNFYFEGKKLDKNENNYEKILNISSTNRVS